MPKGMLMTLGMKQVFPTTAKSNILKTKTYRNLKILKQMIIFFLLIIIWVYYEEIGSL
jgi:hypothetical protein